MTPATVETPEVDQKQTVGDRLVDDACRQAAHISHEARLLKSVAEDAIEDGVHAAKRAIKSVQRRAEELGDLKDEAIHRVKRQPLKAVGLAVSNRSANDREKSRMGAFRPAVAAACTTDSRVVSLHLYRCARLGVLDYCAPDS